MTTTRRERTRGIARRTGLHGDVGHVRRRPSESESIATIHAALDAGINLLDTGDFYGMGHNEMLDRRGAVGRATATRPLISVKFGAQRGPDGSWLGYDARPAAVKTALAYSLQRLRTDHIDIYRPARLDPQVPIEETIGAIAEMVAGRLRALHRALGGRLGHDPPRRRRASDLRPADRVLADLARASSARSSRACRELGIAITAYGVLSRGLISGHWSRRAAASARRTSAAGRRASRART